jgi:hypothetical protein
MIVAGLGYFLSYKLIVWYRTYTPRGRLYVLKMLHKKRKQLHWSKKKVKAK